MAQAALPARLLATWFGCGLSPKAPGTVGSVGAVPLHFALATLAPVPHAAIVVALSLVGIWASNEVAKAEGIEDPQKVVIDEVCGTLIAMGMVSGASIGFRLLGLVLFRVLDITKPGPIDTVQRLEPPGVGIMADDLLAGLVAGAMAYSASALLGH
ncbi:MAG TPA: phosphatidylglycerophosphatase A [Polyangiaceae bacterium]|nr:phosphatidylglycerophosphatase A [Polyangiaceae bacterium]